MKVRFPTFLKYFYLQLEDVQACFGVIYHETLLLKIVCFMNCCGPLILPVRGIN